MVPTIEIVTAAEGDERWLTTVAKVQAMVGADADEDLIGNIINQVSGQCADYCRLAAGIGGEEPTFGREVIRATWWAVDDARGPTLYLPWRFPIVSIDAMTVDGTVLEEFPALRSGYILGLTAGWPAGAIIAEMTVGWELPDNVPAGLEGAVLEQVRMQYNGRERDPGLRSEDIPGVWSGAYNIPGGDSVSSSGLLRSLEYALDRYRKLVFA